MSIRWVEWALYDAPVPPKRSTLLNVLLSFCWHADDAGFTFPSARLIADQQCLTRRGVQKLIAELEQLALIEFVGVRAEYGGAHEYVLCGTPAEELGELANKARETGVIHGRPRTGGEPCSPANRVHPSDGGANGVHPLGANHVPEGANGVRPDGEPRSPKRSEKGPEKGHRKSQVRDQVADSLAPIGEVRGIA